MAIEAVARPRRPTPWALSSVRRIPTIDKVVLISAAAVVALAVLAPVIAPHDPTVAVGSPLEHPGAKFLLGTDQIGFDMFSRVLFGLRASLFAAACVVTSGVLIGGVIGLTAGASHRWVDRILMRLTDVFLALPAPIVAIAVVAALGPGFIHTLVALGVVWWPWYARIVRGQIVAVRVRPHVVAARLAGVGWRRLWLRHLLPGALPEVVVVATFDIGVLVLVLAGLSFLGLGAPAPAPELGAMSAQGLRFLLSAWWVPLFPAVAVSALSLISNLAGDAVRDLLDRR
jgi:peptide/nickel transport system permease protein